MKSFCDNTGRTWIINVNVGTIKRVRALCNVDLANIISIENGSVPKVDLLEKLANDPVLLVDVLYAFVKMKQTKTTFQMRILAEPWLVMQLNMPPLHYWAR